MTNYICINGKKAELTEEQMKALGIELPKLSPFERVCNKANDFYSYYYIDGDGHVKETIDRGYENGVGMNDWHYRVANYCTDREILYQRALHETLNRLLWRYSMEHDGDKIDFKDDRFYKHFIVFDNYTRSFYINNNCSHSIVGITYFFTREIAEAAIEEVIKPFMKAHPEFVW